MARRVFSRLALFATILALAGPAQAGDRAQINLLGFSADGRYFAFEEFGIQDGAGFPYSTIYALDLPKDAWIAGAPFKVRLEDEGAPLAEARSKASRLAAGPLGELPIEVPAAFTALNGDGEPGDGQTLPFGPPGLGSEAPATSHELSLSKVTVPAPAACATYTSEPIVGFSLQLNGQTVYADTRIPDSRNCPLSYRLYGVVEPVPAGLGAPARVAIVSVYSLGFEGPDRRFIAVPLPADSP